MTINIANAAAITMLDALTALANVGGTGLLRVYDGAVPADTDTALSSNTVLVDFSFPADGFPDASDGTGNAVSVANAIDDVNASATGTATFFRLLDNAGTAIMQGSVTATGGGGDVTITSVSVTSGQPCSVTSFTVRMPEGA